MKTIAVFHSTAAGSSDPKIAGICRAAWDHEFNVRRFDFHSSQHVRETLAYWRPDGCIIEAGALDKAPAKHTFGRIPTVFFDCNPAWADRGVSTLTQDAEAVAAAAANELFAISTACYAYASWPQKAFWNDSRRSAFERIVAAHGHRAHLFRPRKGRRDAASIKNQLADWLSALPHPAGVFAATDSMSAQVLEAASSCGLDTPGDIAVIGVDDEELICDYTHPTLSSVSPDFEAAGHRCVEIVARLISHPDCAPVNERFPPPHVVRRASTRQSGKCDRSVMCAIDQIRVRATEGISTADVLSEFQCSRRLAEQRFRAATGHSIMDEIHAVQVERAKRLLLNPLRKISTVAGMCGHSGSVSFFQRLFKRTTGCTMQEWRESGGHPRE